MQNYDQPKLTMNQPESTRIGDWIAEFDGQTLSLAPGSGQPPALSLPVEQVYELFEFVNDFSNPETSLRMAFRVPIFDSQSLTVQVAAGLQLFEATPVNISMNGILLAFPADAPRMPLMDPVTLSISTRTLRIRLFGEIRTARKHYHGVYFVDAVKGNELSPPDELAEIVMQMQREWLAGRSARSKSKP